MKRPREYRGPYKLTVIDPNKRIAKGLPIRQVLAEMESYGIQDPYGRRNQYYFDEYVCLWEVSEAEIVGHWDWDSLEKNENWYQDIIMPACRAFSATNPTEEAIDDLLTTFNELSGMFATSTSISRELISS